MRYTEEMQSTLDIDWFAIDEHHAIAHFASGGGILPESIASAKEDNETLARFFRNLPVISDEFEVAPSVSEQLGSKNLPEQQRYLEDFIRMSQKGFFSYDKSGLGDFMNSEYHLVIIPKIKLDFKKLPLEIRSILEKTRVVGSFSEKDIIDIKATEQWDNNS